MQDQYISETKHILDTISYKNEWVMKFDKFVSQFVKTVDEMEKQQRGLHNADIVELIRNKTTNPKLSQYVTALKVQF